MKLPKRVKLVDTKAFVIVDLEEMELKGDGGDETLRLRDLSSCLCQGTALNFQYSILHALNGRRKVSTVKRWANELSLFFRTVNSNSQQKISTISFSVFNQYYPKKNASQQKLLRSALLYWIRLGVSGIERDLQDYLITSAAPKPRKTGEIQNLVPHERPFRLAEIRNILAVIDDLLISKEFTPQENLMWRLIISEALRPSQLRLLQIGDLTAYDANDNELKRVILKVPIVKQAGTPARDCMFEVQVSEPISRAIHIHLSYLKLLFGTLPGSSYPLFCVSPIKGAQDKPREASIGIIHTIVRTRMKIAARVDGLGDYDIFTRRFKHTKLTHLAILGAPIEVLARSGYQTSTISLRHYTNLTDEAFAEYEKVMSETHEEVFNAFRGRVIASSAATNLDSSHMIVAPDLEHTLGACASNPCDAFAPVACYSCPRFEAFTDGTHEIVLEFLLKRRSMARDAKLSMDTIDRDAHLISAVSHVIKEIKKKEAHG